MLESKKSLAYIVGIMNMVLQGIEAPNILHTNSLNEKVMDSPTRRRVLRWIADSTANRSRGAFDLADWTKENRPRTCEGLFSNGNPPIFNRVQPLGSVDI